MVRNTTAVTGDRPSGATDPGKRAIASTASQQPDLR